MKAKLSALLFVARLFCAVLALALAATAMPTFIAPAQAQQQSGERQGGGLLRFLFQRNDGQGQVRSSPRSIPQVQQAPRRATTETRSQQPQQQRQRQRQRQQTQSGTASAAAPVAPTIVEKAENAQRILVIGDFLAGGLSEGLSVAFADKENVVVIDRSNGSSGLVRDDYYDWPGQIDALLEAEEPAVVVMMIGSNDRQQMRVAGTREQPRSDAWTAEYERRAAAIAKSVRAKQLPLVWVGSLPFKSRAMSSDMLAFNDIYRRVVTDAAGEFVDVWDGFVDENGAFVASGPDMNGQPAQLRSGDGINVTRQGRRKIAFYVEKPLNRILDSDASPSIARLTPGIDDQIYGPEFSDSPDAPAVKIDRTAPIAIDDPELDGGMSLLGAVVTPGTSISEAVSGLAPEEEVTPQSGRADDFTRRTTTPSQEDAAATDPQETTALRP